jgi:hypothetical protein
MHPKPGTPIARAVQRLTFRDQASPPQNNLNLPFRSSGSPPNDRGNSQSGRSATPSRYQGEDFDTYDDDPRDTHVHLHFGGEPYRNNNNNGNNNNTRQHGDEEEERAPVPLDNDLLRLAQQAGDQTVIEQIYAEQEQRNARRQQPNGDRRRARDQQLPDLDQLGEGEEEEPDESDMVEEQLVGTLPEPPEGKTYSLEREPDGSINVVLVDDVDDSIHVNDRAYTSFSGPRDPILTRMNRNHRNIHRRRTGDGDTVKRVIFRHTPLKPYETMQLVFNPSGSVDVVLVSPVPGDDMFTNPRGSQRLRPSGDGDQDDVTMSGHSPRVEGENPLPTPTFQDRALYPAHTLRSMNAMNRNFWHRK